MSTFHHACLTLAHIIRDYRYGALPLPDGAHVAAWASQFPAYAQEPIVVEMAHVLQRSYCSKDRAIAFLDRLITSAPLCGNNPAAFWQATEVMQIQTAGNSQREFVALLEACLIARYGLPLTACGHGGSRYLYLDDGLFSGGRIKSDLTNWIQASAPASAEVIIATIVCHEQGYYFTKQDLERVAREAGKTIRFRFVREVTFGDRIFNDAATDVLRPKGPGPDNAVQAYVDSLGKEQQWRTVTSSGPCGLFSSDATRSLLEQEFLREGVGIRAKCPHLNAYQRPLGNTTMRTTGFGTMFVSWRNCPNNAPLVLWAGDPWYPLFRRITN